MFFVTPPPEVACILTCFFTSRLLNLHLLLCRADLCINSTKINKVVTALIDMEFSEDKADEAAAGVVHLGLSSARDKGGVSN